MSPNVEGGGEVCRVSVNEYSCAHGAQINFGDLTPFLTYGFYGESMFGPDHSARELRRPYAGERHLPPAPEARGHPGACSW